MTVQAYEDIVLSGRYHTRVFASCLRKAFPSADLAHPLPVAAIFSLWFLRARDLGALYAVDIRIGKNRVLREAYEKFRKWKKKNLASQTPF